MESFLWRPDKRVLQKPGQEMRSWMRALAMGMGESHCVRDVLQKVYKN